MSSKSVMKEPLVLRVRANGELDKVMRHLMAAEEPVSRHILREVGGLRRSDGLVRKLSLWFDNVQVDVVSGDPDKHTSLRYIDIAPKAPVSIGADVITIEGVSEKPKTEAVEKIQWPQAPPLIEKMENFDKPAFFETMRAMVKAGKHISLESPPGLGKDTAVQQLAAQEGMPLVTVSGDGGFRRRDLVGSQELSNGSSYFQVGEYAAAAINGWWVLITEVNAADPDVLLFINSQLAPPKTVNVHGKAYPVHPNFRLFVSYNAGLIGTKPLPQSFKDRFFPVKISFFTENQLVNRLQKWGLPEGDVSWAWAIVQYGLRMWSAHEKGKMRYQITVRRLVDAIDMVNMGVANDAFAALKDAVVSAIDSPIEAKVAKQVLKDVRDDYNRRFPNG